MGEVSSLFSSPSKQGSQAASASQAIGQQTIDQAENYYNNAEQNQRGAIANLGTNPYFGGSSTAASGSGGSPVPAPQKLNPSYTVAFSPQGAQPASVPVPAQLGQAAPLRKAT